MSYRNPTQYIDRQSGQIEQNLQKTLAGIGTGVVASINKIHADNAAKTAAIRAEADKRVADAQNSIMQTQSKNPTADFGDLDSQLDLMNKLLMKDPAKRTAEEKTFINSMENIGDNMANMLKNTAMSQEAMMEQVNKIPGTMGAIDPKANPEQYAKLSVLANQTEGRTKARYKTNKNGQIVFSLDVYQKTKDGEKFVGSVINDNVATTQMPAVVPNISKDIDQNIQNTINLVDPTSELSPVLNNDKSEILYHQDKFGRRVNPEDFKNKLKVQSKSTLSQFSDRKLASLYNNVLNPGDTDFSYDTPLSDDQKNKAEEALLNYMMKQPAVTKVLGNIVESKIPTKKGSVTKKITEGDYKRLTYKNKVKYLDGRFTPENVTFESAFELANEEGIKVEKLLEEITEEVIELKLGNIIINKTDSPEIIKKKLLIAGGVKNEDAEALINKQSQSFRPYTGPYTGNLPIKKIN